MYYLYVTFYNKNKECYLQYKKLKLMSVILDGSKLFIIFTEYLLDTKKGMLSGYRLYPVVLKENNNGGKEVNFKGRKAKM